MPQFRPKPIPAQAHQWQRNGDHPLDYVDDIFDLIGASPPATRPSTAASRIGRAPWCAASGTQDRGLEALHQLRVHSTTSRAVDRFPATTELKKCPGDWM